MKVALLRCPYDLELVDRPVPSPAPDEVLIRLRAAGICGSDVHGLAGEHPLMTLPRVLGHELAGQVEAVGSEVTRASTGDRSRVQVYEFEALGKQYLLKYDPGSQSSVAAIHVEPHSVNN